MMAATKLLVLNAKFIIAPCIGPGMDGVMNHATTERVYWLDEMDGLRRSRRTYGEPYYGYRNRWMREEERKDEKVATFYQENRDC